MDLGLVNKTALVTGASRGLGLACALALAAEGAKLTICARGEDDLRKAQAQITDLGAPVLALAADVTEPQAPAELVAATVERYGAVDIVVANTGGPPVGGSLEVDDDAILAAINANLLTSVRLVRESVPYMRASGWGRICLITSVTVKEPARSLALSGTARTGLWAWAKTAAADLAPEGITLNLACPGGHNTDRNRQLGGTGRRLGDPADFGKVVAFLCSDAARFVSGTALAVDGAATAGLL